MKTYKIFIPIILCSLIFIFGEVNSADIGRIVYIKNDNNIYIYMNGKEKQLTKDNSDKSVITFSDDGEKILYISDFTWNEKEKKQYAKVNIIDINGKIIMSKIFNPSNLFDTIDSLEWIDESIIGYFSPGHNYNQYEVIDIDKNKQLFWFFGVEFCWSHSKKIIAVVKSKYVKTLEKMSSFITINNREIIYPLNEKTDKILNILDIRGDDDVDKYIKEENINPDGNIHRMGTAIIRTCNIFWTKDDKYIYFIDTLENKSKTYFVMLDLSGNIVVNSEVPEYVIYSEEIIYDEDKKEAHFCLEKKEIILDIKTMKIVEKDYDAPQKKHYKVNKDIYDLFGDDIFQVIKDVRPTVQSIDYWPKK